VCTIGEWFDEDGCEQRARSSGDSITSRSPCFRTGRAHRLPGLELVDVFEVDHPATQAYKRRLAGGLPLLVRYVAVDFERDVLAQRLADGGHDGARPTLWIWEGVVT
jgi:hypothetical protein